LVSKNSSIPPKPPSWLSPDSLNPPKDGAGSEITYLLLATIPDSGALAVLITLIKSDESI
jgi:hypothetical protein